MSSKYLHVSVIQLNSISAKAENLQKAVAMAKTAINNGAEFIALPEMFNLRGAGANTINESESIPGPSLIPLLDLCANHHVWILAGSIAETSGQEKIYNTSVLLSPLGIHAVYRKLHLFDAELDIKHIRESDLYAAGKHPILTDVKGIPTGLSICYDLRFPELFQRYFRHGAQMMCVPSSFTTPTGCVHWELLLRARAIETQSYVIAPNQAGIGTGGVPTFGNSMIIDPWGTILARASETKEEIISAVLDFESLATLRKKFPFLQHKRL
jgi:predicted amidohydrolase